MCLFLALSYLRRAGGGGKGGKEFERYLRRNFIARETKNEARFNMQS